MIEYKVKVQENVTEWYLNNQLHREDGPAVEWSNGDKNGGLMANYIVKMVQQ